MTLSPMAREDIAHLQAQGITLTPEQIVILNALALRVERGPEAADLVRAPRVAWAGSTPIYEPTIAAERWLDTFGLHWWHGRSAALCTAWACANCAAPGFFVDKTDERRVRSLIQDWQDGLDCTAGQLFMALSYVVDGADPDPSETPTAAPNASRTKSRRVSGKRISFIAASLFLFVRLFVEIVERIFQKLLGGRLALALERQHGGVLSISITQQAVFDFANHPHR